MSKFLQALLLVALLSAWAVVVYYSDPLLLSIIVYIGLLWLGAPCVIVAAIIFLFAKATNRPLRPPVFLLVGLLVFASLCAVTIPINRFVQQRAIVAAKSYPDRIAPLIEQYRQTHGVYPISLDQLPTKPRVPRLLRTSYGYQSDGRHYSFHFSQPGGVIDVWDYDSETHQWHLST